MKVLFFLKYDINQASARVRGFYMAEALKKMGLQCDITFGFGRYIRPSIKMLTYDIVFFHRTYFRIDLLINKILTRRKTKTIFDIDDAPGGIHLSPKKERNAARMMKDCSAVTIGSHALKDFAEQYAENVYLMPSPIALQYYQPSRERKNAGAVTLGWIGNGINYKQDLFMLLGPLRNLGKKYKIKLILIGALGDRDIYRNFRNLGDIEVTIIDWLPWKNPYSVPEAIAQFDIGLYPLLDRKYNKYKCSFKGLEYLAMEVPVVASPVGENRIVFEANTDALLPSNEGEWEESIARLIEDEALRSRLGKNGRKKIEERYSTEICARQLLNVFKNVLD